MGSNLPWQPVQLLAAHRQKVLCLLLQPLGQRTQARRPRQMSAIDSNAGTPITEQPAAACAALAGDTAADFVANCIQLQTSHDETSAQKAAKWERLSA
jgi:hypothetical protein